MPPAAGAPAAAAGPRGLQASPLAAPPLPARSAASAPGCRVQAGRRLAHACRPTHAATAAAAAVGAGWAASWRCSRRPGLGPRRPAARSRAARAAAPHRSRGRRDSVAVRAIAEGPGRPGSWDPDDPDEPAFPSGFDWDWGEIYIWGGVTWVMGRDGAGDGNDENEKPMEKVAPRVKQAMWEALSAQYPKAVKEGAFAGTPLSRSLAARRFESLADHALRSTARPEALEIIRSDTTPLLVEPDGVQCAFDLLTGVCGNAKEALELVRKHPGLLVGGTRSMKEGTSLVTATLVDVLFAGRLLDIAEDPRPQAWKLAEIEFYASVAALFKPVMDLVQRRSVVI
ncbi:unnamed protein product [Prorocentrum cordatum]|uniref:Queuosine salvage protein n=1 Tax=Prorocentrum cordatum TaxID=2364126 RepID=A0ABN9XL28_9DINO|nr:unnamed protein product [Polarella glacialis]